MIANQHGKGWEIIYHRAHALLAAEIAGHWHSKEPKRIIETVAAISHHDDLKREREWEGKDLTPAGTPLDFTLDQETDLKKIKEQTINSRYPGSWVAMLISMHTILNEGRRG